MPLHVPDRHIVGIRNFCCGFFGSFWSYVPINQGSVHGTARKYRLVHRVPCDARNFFMMALQRAQLSHRPNVIEFDQLISTRCQQPVAVIIPRDLGDRIFMPVQCAQTGPRSRIPQLDQIVLGPRTYYRRSRMPLHAFHVPSVTLQYPLLPVSSPVPNPHGSIVTAANKLRISRTETQRVYGLTVVAVQTLNGSDAWAPVFDVAPRIARQQVILVVRPRHASEGLVMGRHDELEGKVDAIPEREFSLLISREETSSPRGPA
mmetsp:Transcript_4146/g.10528  ORF Transcript_4146/g.10528 Transcript_4146/m.10528 type:complete len:261 (-) Transcript_4146:95-877(-)